MLQKLKYLLSLQKNDQLYNMLLTHGLDAKVIDEYLADKSKTTAKKVTGTELEQDIKQLFDLGGVVSGGSALAFLHHTHTTTKDIDFYFNNDIMFLKACILTRKNASIDCCYYFDQPHELHDIGLVMCNLYFNRGETTPPAQRALITNISDIFLENIIQDVRVRA